MDQEFFDKIETLVNSIVINLKDLNSKKDSYYQQYPFISSYKDTNEKKYRYELEKNNYQILKVNNEIVKHELFIARCRAYLKYLKSLDSTNEILIKEKEYEFIKTFQNEVIHYYYGRIKELELKSLIERICEVEPKAIVQRNDMLAKREEILNKFSNSNFNIKKSKLYTNEYLNYNVDEVIENLYSKKEKKIA